MELMKRHLSWMSYVSIGSKVAIGILLMIGLSIRDATLIVAAPIIFAAMMLVRSGIREQYWMPIEEVYELVEENMKQWVFIATPREAPTSESQPPSLPSKSPSTPGHSVAPSPVAPSAFLPIPKRTLFR